MALANTLTIVATCIAVAALVIGLISIIIGLISIIKSKERSILVFVAMANWLI
jgi:hypothetical protein